MSAGYPLSAIVGQRDLLDALLVNAVSPEVGGVLVRGERGTAKSTAVRGLAPLLPPVAAAEGQSYAFAPGELGPHGRVPADAATESRPAPLVELPLGATLDRLIGSLDLGRAVDGERAFEPGLLARAHNGILYVDEVNLLPDHLVDALLDAAASGVARVEREAVSAEHASRFLLVGTMNVEEGELRPQLLDRFGLGVEVRAPADPAQRAEIVRRRLAFERDPDAFAARFEADDRALAGQIAAARERLDAVRLGERELSRITIACARLGVDGVRGDIVSARTARALAALDGVDEVGEEHLRRAVLLALAHRRRSDPLDGTPQDPAEIERALESAGPEDEGPDDDGPGGGPTRGPSSRGASDGNGGDPSGGGTRTHDDGAAGDPAPAGEADPAADAPADPTIPARERRDAPAPALLPPAALTLVGTGGGPTGRRARSRSAQAGSIDSMPARPESDDLAVVATLRARLLGADPGTLREHVRAGREGALICLVLDASGSMGARRRLARVKGAVLDLLRESHARRDRVAVVAFRDSEAEVVVTPGAPLERAAEAVRGLGTGGRSPLDAGLHLAAEELARERRRESGRRAIAIVVTDGRVADPDGTARRAAQRLGRAADAVHVVDTEEGMVRFGIAPDLARAAGGSLHRLAPAPSERRRAA
ncbi:MAG TPA: VWA domain-containing protein [Solirubrobacterales bacterium]|nr:VWA domain-containing protein [Solirubrobacterales bacterium]